MNVCSYNIREVLIMVDRKIDDQTIEKMEELLNVASDFTRLKIMHALLQGEKNVGELIEEVGASQSLVSHQLQVLRKNRLVSVRKDGTRAYYILNDEHINKLFEVVYEHVKEKEETGE